MVNALGKQWHVEVSEARRWGVPQASCYIRSLALQPLHAPTQALWLAPSRDPPPGCCCPSSSLVSMGARRPECTDHGQAAAPTFFLPVLTF